MSLHYLWAFDLELVGAASVRVTDDGGTFDATVSDGTYVLDDFGHALIDELNAGSSGTGVYSYLGYSLSAGHRIRYTGPDQHFSMDFGAHGEAGERMQAILGFQLSAVDETMLVEPPEHPGWLVHQSDARPFYHVIPATQGRSVPVTDEYEPAGIVEERVADDGSARQIARDTAEIWSDWHQAAETNGPPTAAFAAGTVVHRRHAPAIAPWTYQHMFAHAKDGQPPFLVIEDEAPEGVYTLRAEGCTFKPERMVADLDLFSIAFMTRLQGRL